MIAMSELAIFNRVHAWQIGFVMSHSFLLLRHVKHPSRLRVTFRLFRPGLSG